MCVVDCSLCAAFLSSVRAALETRRVALVLARLAGARVFDRRCWLSIEREKERSRSGAAGGFSRARSVCAEARVAACFVLSRLFLKRATNVREIESEGEREKNPDREREKNGPVDESDLLGLRRLTTQSEERER